VTLLMHENSDFLRLVVNSIRKDLHGNNEVDNCLALHAIANVGGSEMAEALAEDVHRLLISPYVLNPAVSFRCPQDHDLARRRVS
jgi:AP-2 complex subunit alpha